MTSVTGTALNGNSRTPFTLMRMSVLTCPVKIFSEKFLMAITVAIADDHPVVVSVLMQLFQRDSSFHVEHCCNEGSLLIESLARASTDIVVVDYSMTRGNRPVDGLALLRKLRDVAPKAGRVLFTAQKNPTVFAAAVRLGVAAIVSKEDEVGEILRACRYINDGGSHYLSPTVRTIVDQAGTVLHEAPPPLTQKELDVVRLFVSGHSLADIAKQLGRSVSTVSTQKYTAMRKLRADTNIHLIRYAYENGLL
ncbi:response regulator transcription factor [Burkholderia sp. NRF60-BP8]|uniref:response regulator transcription factor n=1 Tax=Burkholderia sp. NRF60-BP8 TaxID=1637853 RepID=UPI001F26CF4F|nr:response regulator transcription factor [Burkholderia sp. NRF60-BP8]